ncbi:flavin-containing monooxygenase [Gordonia terrae]|uniref:flavin-containing monooxygenase n=1 Tax=Gordonia terrae TaxID=2055 RepID=UPI003F6AE1B4
MTTELVRADEALDLESAVGVANPALLLASLVTMTGDTSPIERYASRLRHHFDGTGIVAELPSEDARELRAWAIEAMNKSPERLNRDASDLSDADFAALCSALVGWTVAPESAEFYREQGGFVRFAQTLDRTAKAPEGFKLAVMGAGMAGISTAISAKRAGIDVTVLESRPALGGVWWKNTYPGVGVDTPSAFYSFHFELNPDWKKAFPTGAEYLDYLEKVVEKYDIGDTLQFNSTVTSMTWLEDDQEWEIRYIADGEEALLRANAVVTAAGYLTGPQFPTVEGLSSFAGTSFHSSEWDHSCDFKGKRVAVVGTGCTSVQIVDSLIEEVSSLSVFQRQPHWVMPSAGKDPLPHEHRWLAKNFPFYVNWHRLLTFLPSSDSNYEMVRFDEKWASEHDLSISPLNDEALKVGLSYLDEMFADRPDLKEKLTPSFAPWGKRIIRDPGRYFEALKSEKSELVTSGITSVVPEGIIDGEGRLHEVDIIVYATGFEFKYLSHIDIAGKGGQLLADVWQDSPAAYNGCQVPGFPNLFITSGPHASPGHGGGHNFPVEMIVHYVMESLQLLFETNSSSLEVTDAAFDAWVTEMTEQLKDSIWARETRSTTYYRNSRGDVILPNPLRFEDWWARLRQPAETHIVLK